MQRRILVRGARQLLTLSGPSGPRRGEDLNNLGIIDDGAVLIVDGIVTTVGPSRRVENLTEAKSAREINAAGRVVMPGFIDSHTHLISGAAHLGAYERAAAGADDSEQHGGELLKIPLTLRGIPARLIESQARRLTEGCTRHGTTTIEAKTGYCADESTELKALKVLAGLNDATLAVVSTYISGKPLAPTPADYFQWLCEEFLPKIALRKLARFADGICDSETLKQNWLRTYLDAGKRAGLIPKMHCASGYNEEAVPLAIETEAASIDGLSEVKERDAGLLAGCNTIATLIPFDAISGYADRFAPVRMLVDRGAAIALASGLHRGGITTFNMQTVLSAACTYMKLSIAEAISAATINAAHAIRMAGRIGSLQAGKDGDIIMLNVSDYRDISYHYGVNQVALVMKQGRVIYEEAGLIHA